MTYDVPEFAKEYNPPTTPVVGSGVLTPTEYAKRVAATTPVTQPVTNKATAVYDKWISKSITIRSQLSELEKQKQEIYSPVYQMTKAEYKKLGGHKGLQSLPKDITKQFYMVNGKRYETWGAPLIPFASDYPKWATDAIKYDPMEDVVARRIIGDVKVKTDQLAIEYEKALIFSSGLDKILTNPDISIDEAINLALQGAGTDVLSSADMDEFRDALEEQMGLLSPSILEPDQPGDLTPKLKTPLPEPKPIGMTRATVELIKNSLMAPKIPDQVMSDAEWKSHLEAEQSYDPDMKAVMDQREKEWQDQIAQIEAYRKGVKELPTWKFSEFFRESLLSPIVSLAESYSFYAEHVSQPIAGTLWKTLIPDIESAYQRYRKEGSTHREALYQAWQGWQAPGAEGGHAEWMPDWLIKYVLMEGICDPLTYIGWNVPAKISTLSAKGLAKVGWGGATRPLMAFAAKSGAAEAAMARLMDLPFDFIKAGWEKLPKSTMQKAALIRSRTGQYNRAGFDLFLRDKAIRTGGAVKNFMTANKQDFIEYTNKAINFAMRHPGSEDVIAQGGRDMLMHKTLTREQVERLAKTLKSNLGDISDKNILDVSETFENFFTTRNFNRSKASRELVRILDGTGNDSLSKATKWIKDYEKRIIDDAKSFAKNNDKPVEALRKLGERNFEFTTDDIKNLVSLEKTKIARWQAWADEVTGPLSRVWQNTIDRNITRPMATAYLTFGMYGPMNVLEDYLRTMLGGVMPGRKSTTYWASKWSGCIYPDDMLRTSFSETMGFSRHFSDPVTNNNWVLTLSQAPISVPVYGITRALGKPITPEQFAQGTKYLLNDRWNNIGADMRRNYLDAKGTQILLRKGGKEVQALVKAVQRFNGTTDKALNHEVTQYISGLALSADPGVIKSATNFFTMKNMKEKEFRKILMTHENLSPEIKNLAIEWYRDGRLFSSIPKIKLPDDFIDIIDGISTSLHKVAQKIAKQEKLDIHETQFYSNHTQQVEETLKAMAGSQFSAGNSIDDFIKNEAYTFLRKDVFESPELAGKQIKAFTDMMQEAGIKNPEAAAAILRDIQIVADTLDIVPKEVAQRTSAYSRGLNAKDRGSVINKALDDIEKFQQEAGEDMKRLVDNVHKELTKKEPAVADYDIGLAENIPDAKKLEDDFNIWKSDPINANIIKGKTPEQLNELYLGKAEIGKPFSEIDYKYIEKLKDELSVLGKKVPVTKPIESTETVLDDLVNDQILLDFANQNLKVKPYEFREYMETEEGAWTLLQKIKDYGPTSDVGQSVDEFIGRIKLATGEEQATINQLIETWFKYSDNNTLQTLGRVSSQSPEYLAGIRKILNEKYPSGYIRIYRGSGKAKEKFIDREFTNITSSRKTALDFEDTWLVESGIKSSVKEENQGIRFNKPSPIVDNVLVKVDDIVSIGSVDESELIIPSSILKDRISNPLPVPAIYKFDQNYVNAVDQVLNMRMAKSQELTNIRNEFHNWRRGYFSTDVKRESAFWEIFWGHENDYLYKTETASMKYDGIIRKLHDSADRVAGITKPPRQPIIVQNRPLAPSDIAGVLQIRMNDLTSNLMEQLTVQHDRRRFVDYVKSFLLTEEEKYFDDDSIGRVFDQIVNGLTGGKNIDMLTAKEMELEALRKELHDLYNSHKIKQADIDSINQYIGTTAKAVDDVVYETKEVPAFANIPPEKASRFRDLDTRPFESLTKQEADELRILRNEISAMQPGIESTLSKQLEKYVNGLSKKNLNDVRIVGSSITGKAIPNDIDIVYDLRGVVQGTDETIEDAIIRVVESIDGFDAELYDTFYKVGNRYFHLSQGAGRDIVENTEYALAQAGKPSISLIHKKGVGNIGPQRVKKDIFQHYDQLKQESLDEATKLYYKDFTDYTHGNMIDDFMKVIYPFWTYESRRWQWLPRAMVQHPVVFTTLGKYVNESDDSYLHVPGTSIDINPFRGTVFGPVVRSQTRQYPSYYDSLPFGGIAEYNDLLGRWGFYPGAPWNIIQSMIGGQESQLGEVLPGTAKSILDVAVAIFPKNDMIKFISERIFSDRFRDYMTWKEIDRRGGDGATVRKKITAGDKLTPEEEAIYTESRSQVSWYSAGFEQFGLLRFRPQEQIEIREACGQAIYEMTGFTPDQQDEMYDKGINLWDYVGGMSPSQQAVLEALGYWKYSGISQSLMSGEQQSISDDISQGWTDVENYNKNTILPSTKEIQRQFLAGQIGPDEYNQKVKEIYAQKKLYIDNKVAETPMMLLENRGDYYKKFGKTQPVMHPMKEMLALYFGIELKQTIDLDTGAIIDDWDKFYAERESVEQAIPDELRAEWDDYISKNQAPLDKIRREVYSEYFSKYYGVWDSIIARYSPEEQRLIREYMNLERTGKSLNRQEELKAMPGPNNKQLISGFKSDVSDAKQALRYANPYLDAWLRYWGITSSFLTPQSETAYYNILGKTGRVK